MAFITLQQMFDAWKRVSDWVSGATSDKPMVEIASPLPAGMNKIGLVDVTGKNVKYAWSGSATVTSNNFGVGKSFSITNDGGTHLTFTIGTITITVQPNETFSDNFADFTQVTVTTTVAYRALVRG